MTNPSNAVGTNSAYNGRTSTKAFNDILAGYTTGILSGWECAPNSGMTISLGGGAVRDVAIAEDNTGNKTTINNISGSPVNITLDSAPTSNKRIDAIVAYVDNPAEGDGSTADNPTACGLISVKGNPATNPTAPTESAIRTAITADGGNGTLASFVVLATVAVVTGQTAITGDNITQGLKAESTRISLDKIYPVGSIYITTAFTTASQVASVLGGTWVAWGAGRVPVGVDTSDSDFDSVEATGGEKEHTLTVQEMPSHNHGRADVRGGTNQYFDASMSVAASLGGTVAGNFAQGGGQAHNNLQPYITCYMYKRIA